MPDEEVTATLDATIERFADRHHNLSATFAEHFDLVAHRVQRQAELSHARRALIGAYCTQEYSIEAAALFNPSIIAHPDQTGTAASELRFIMSLRAVGEGHVSSIEFRTGVLGPDYDLRIDCPGRHLVAGRAAPAMMTREFLRDAVADRTDATDHILSLLPVEFNSIALDAALASVERDRLTRGSAEAIVERIRRIASCNYQLQFPPDRPISERVIYPSSPDESHGVEDARFTRFVDDDATITYYATYTAFDGSEVTPHLLQTKDFEIFESTQLIGGAARNKGMALFPRRIRGEYLMLSRWDRESIAITRSTDTRHWGAAVTLRTPVEPWELIQLGNCGSPIETPDGWLVLTHGVGPMREYGIGAILLDLDEPSKVVGALSRPMLTPADEERDGYVPNVVYSCGALIHEQTLVLPYGCSDSSIRVAFVDLQELLKALRAS
jgi:predicted GH43/DUF377 family glycosyl hydrolase